MSKELVTHIDGKRRRTRVDVLTVTKDGKALVFYRGLYRLPELPGGGVDENETVIEAAERELMEESGWKASSLSEFKASREYLFEGKDSAWFTRCGWEQEINYCVVAQLDKFDPDERYGSEGDKMAFDLVPLETLRKQIMLSVKHGLDGRKLMFALLRLEVINYLLGSSAKQYQQSAESFSLRSKPCWCNW